MRKIVVGVKEKGSVLTALGKALPLLPPYAFRKALAARDVRLNGQRINGNTAVVPGDVLVLFTEASDEPIPVLFEDDDSMVVVKPAGLNSDDNHQSGVSLISWAKARPGAGEGLALVHRLDNQTSGLLVLANNPIAEAVLAEAFKSRTLTKEYTALVAGTPDPPGQVSKAWLLKDAKAGKVAISARSLPGSKPIVTEYATITPGAVSRLHIVLHTGRTHQIRAHLAFLGFPVLGDDLYGNRELNRRYKANGLKLCACSLGFPEDFGLEGLRGKRFEINPPF